MSRPYEFLARIAKDGTVYAHTRTIEELSNDREFENDAVPMKGIDNPGFETFAKAFSAAALQKIEDNQSAFDAEKKELQIQIATLKSEKASLQNELDSVHDEKQDLLDSISEKNVEIVELNDSVSSLRFDNDQLAKLVDSEHAKANVLKVSIETASDLLALKATLWNPRTITAEALFDRLTKMEIENIMASGSPQVIGLIKVIQLKKNSGVLLEMDSPQFQAGLKNFVTAGIIETERIPILLADSTVAEAKLPTPIGE